jgi:acetyl-CoA carboxylase biotin carboxyl carrier protein
MSTVEERPQDAATAADHLRQLSDVACRLVANVAGPLRRIRLRDDRAVIELEWECAASPDVAAARPVAVAAVDPPGPMSPPVSGEGELICSPMVGTFYHAPAPDEAAFVSVGSTVEPDTVIGIVEAMKLMNPITADKSGVVREVLTPNGQPVEFDQPLVVLVPKDRD